MVRATGRAVVLESRAHFVSKYEVVYTSDPPARISDDRIQLFRTQHSVVVGNLDVNFSKCGVWPGGQSPTAPLYLQVQVAHAYKFPWK